MLFVEACWIEENSRLFRPPTMQMARPATRCVLECLASMAGPQPSRAAAAISVALFATHSSTGSTSSTGWSDSRRLLLFGGAGLASLGSLALLQAQAKQEPKAKTAPQHAKLPPTPSPPQLPTYTSAEVAQHRTPVDRVWVTFKDGVYDITDFIPMHPGGMSKIMMAAGGSIDPFWAMYQQHAEPAGQ